MKYFIILLSVIVVAETVLSYENSFQVESIGSFAIQKSPSAFDTASLYGAGMNSRIRLSHRFSPVVSFFIEEQQGLAGDEINYWQRTPHFNNLKTGLEIEGPGIIQTTVSNRHYPYSEAYTPSYMPSYESCIPTMLNTGSFHWTVGREKPLVFVGDVSYFNYRYELINEDPDPPVSGYDESRYDHQQDNDLWSRIKIQGNFPSGFHVILSSRIKTDFEKNSTYDLQNHYFSLGGYHGNRRSRIMLDWYVRERFVKSHAMALKNYHQDFSTEIGIRPILKIKTGMYIKGNAQVVIAENVYRQFLELTFRRWWKSGSTIDIIYWNSAGGLFPRQSAVFSTTIYPVEHFGFSPKLDVRFGNLYNRGTYRFYCAEGNLDLLFPLNGRTVINCGGKYTYFKRHPHFGSGTTIYAGVRRW